VASGEYDAEHVHQLRVGLRRLRTALRLFAPVIETSPQFVPLDEQAATLFRALGAARDRVAIAEPMERELTAALQAAGLSFRTPTLPFPADACDPAELLRAGPAQGLLLDLFDVTQTPAAAMDEGEPALRALAAKRLRRWHRQAQEDAARFASLDDAARHRLRRRFKRLRYGVEFVGDLFERRRLRPYEKSLRALQERLGGLVDITLALDAYRRTSASDPHALFAVGWLAARKDRLLHDSARDMAAFGKLKGFWK
jgi:CHAD domain-containing protein